MSGERQQPAIGPRLSRFRAALYWLVKTIFLVYGRVYHRLERAGRVPRGLEGPVVYVSNHASVLDPPLVGVCVPFVLSFLAKKELFNIPVIGWLIRNLNAIPVRRGAMDRAALSAAVVALRRGGQILLFPEGTRTKDGSLGPGRAGAGMIAALGRARVVPVWVEGTRAALPAGSWFVRPRKVRVTFGEPAELPSRSAPMSNKAYYQRCAEEMMDRIADLRDRIGARPGRRFPSDLQAPSHTLEDVEP